MRDSEHVLHDGRRFRFVELTARLPDGRTARREIVRHPGAVAILPVLNGPAGRSIVLIRNYRPAVGRSIWEIPAGTLEPGEAIENCAGRELIEETGYRAERLVHLSNFLTTPGLTDEVMHTFVAYGLDHVGQDLDDGEHIEVQVTPLNTVREMMTDGSIVDGKSLVALLLADRLGLLDGGNRR